VATSVTIPIHVVNKIKDAIEAGGGINAWVADKGFTVIERLRTRRFWRITVAENLSAQQKAAFETVINNAASALQWS